MACFCVWRKYCTAILAKQVLRNIDIEKEFRYIMQILVDADACPVVRQTEEVAKQYNVPVTLLCDTNHVLHSDYSMVKVIDAGTDAVDMALMNLCKSGDIVITQDYGVAAMVLGKRAVVLHQNGWQYTNDNIDRLLEERHMAKKIRRAKGKHHLRGPRRRSIEDDEKFVLALKRAIEACTVNQKL